MNILDENIPSNQRYLLQSWRIRVRQIGLDTGRRGMQDDSIISFLWQQRRSTALRKLRMLSNAISLNDLRVPPANRLEKLTGERAGQYSIRINDQWRICFEWQEGDVSNVEIADYH